MVSLSLTHTHIFFSKNRTLSYGNLQSDKEMSKANIKKLNELQVNSKRYINYTSIKKQTIKKEKILKGNSMNSETEGILYQRDWNSKQIEILEVKNSINKKKNAIENIKSQQTIWKRELASLKI